MRSSIFFLLDMQDALSRMIEVTKGISIFDFSRNWVLISAVRDQIMILGEAAKQVPPDICESYPEIPWSQLARTRDCLIHGYFKVDPNLLFTMATVRANILLPIITNIIIEIQKNTSDRRKD